MAFEEDNSGEVYLTLLIVYNWIFGLLANKRPFRFHKMCTCILSDKIFGNPKAVECFTTDGSVVRIGLKRVPPLWNQCPGVYIHQTATECVFEPRNNCSTLRIGEVGDVLFKVLAWHPKCHNNVNKITINFVR